MEATLRRYNSTMLPIDRLPWETPPRALELTTDQVHIWRVRLDGVENEDDRLWQTLSPQERERVQRFHFDQHRLRYLRAHGACRAILARYTGLAPEALRIEATPRGKPFLIDTHRLDLRFNLSHSGDWMVIGLACGREIGVDVELIARDIDWKAIASGYFHASEMRAIQDFAAPDVQVAAFYRVWTVKEAYLKAVGKGLAGGLDQVVVQVGPGLSAVFKELPGGENELRRWQVFSFQPAGGAVGAALVEKDSNPLQLTCYHWGGLEAAPS